jgi:Ran GTPase-activating protein (RanGAP) involved in mRNA processing and transport
LEIRSWLARPLLTVTPNLDETSSFVEQEIQDLYPSCAVTRAMAKKAKNEAAKRVFDCDRKVTQDVGLSDTFLGQTFDNEIQNLFCDSVNITHFSTKNK